MVEDEDEATLVVLALPPLWTLLLLLRSIGGVRRGLVEAGISRLELHLKSVTLLGAGRESLFGDLLGRLKELKRLNVATGWFGFSSG